MNFGRGMAMETGGYRSIKCLMWKGLCVCKRRMPSLEVIYQDKRQRNTGQVKKKVMIFANLSLKRYLQLHFHNQLLFSLQ